MTEKARRDLDMVLPDEAVEVALRTVTEIIGEGGMQTVLQRAGLTDYLQGGRLAPGKKVTFAHVGRVTQGLIDVYGERGAAAMLRRAGRLQFTTWLEAYPGVLGAVQTALKALPPHRRLLTVLQASRP